MKSAAWIVAAALTLAGCAHTPSTDRPLKGASEEPVGVTAPAAPTARFVGSTVAVVPSVSTPPESSSPTPTPSASADPDADTTP